MAEKGATNGGSAAAPVECRTTEDVLKAEYARIWGATLGAADDVYDAMYKKNQAALCLSGGGIRSAAFALGILQALSKKHLLDKFNYLSTVSGGGYIGSWLQRWIKEEEEKEEETGGVAAVMTKLNLGDEPEEVRRLRANSNFITPRAGIGSADTWTAIALSLRNIAINWFLFVPLLLLVALLANIFRAGVESVPVAFASDPPFLDVLLFLAAVMAALATASTVRMLPSYRAADPSGKLTGDGWMLLWIVAPLVLWAILGTLALAVDLLRASGEAAKAASVPQLEGILGADVALWTLIGMVVGMAIGAAHLPRENLRAFFGDWLAGVIALPLCAFWIAIGASVYERFSGGLGANEWNIIVLTVVGPLWLMSAQLLVTILFSAFRQSEGGPARPDGDREWFARLSAMKIKPMLLWTALGFCVLVAHPLVLALTKWLGVGSELAVPGMVALASGATAAGGGRSEKSGNTVSSAGGVVLRFISMQTIVVVATFVFIISLFVMMGRIEQIAADAATPEALSIRDWVGLRLCDPLLWIDGEVFAHLLVGLLFAGLLWFLSRLIPVNRFSLNGLYRNRLARAFLGAARPERTPDPFTGFDPKDNLRLHELHKAGEPLYPVINAALNVTATNNLAWQERKAGPFILTPLYCGSSILEAEPEPQVREASGEAAAAPVRQAGTVSSPGAYVGSGIYGGSEADLAMSSSTSGITLATAASISGAAATPNMGYHSSPVTAFLMTLFNVRLGAWLPNPARARSRGGDMGRSGPKHSIMPILRELGGVTDDLGPDVYLSDGGHFDNLAMYEMLRRRCRYIIVSDAGADPQCAFEDLGNAVRKAKIDLNVEISFTKMCISSRTNPVEPQLAWALGEISYPREGETGRILYVKPSFYGRDLPIDIVSYAAGSQSFPHESTGDQFFSESQFESYRKLGAHIAGGLGSDRYASDGDTDLTPLAVFFARVARQQSEELSEVDELERSGFFGWLKRRIGIGNDPQR
jgi:hypothetical protein